MTDVAVGITPLTWPDVVTITVPYLRAELQSLDPDEYPEAAGADCSNRVPEERPVPYVRVQREGGEAGRTHDNATLIIECWHDRDDKAAALANITRDLLRIMPGMRDGWTVTRVEEQSGPSAIADPDSDLPRYVFIVGVTVRAKPRT
jgi:hypothetical protein